MNSDYEVQFVHTEPCYICQGSHAEYVNRQCCRNCESLRDVLMKRGILIRPSDIKTALNAEHRQVKVAELKALGMTRRTIAETMGVSLSVVDKIIQKDNTDV